jgi:uncharacterized protein YwqG
VLLERALTAIRSSALAPHTAALARLLEPSIRIDARACDEAELPIGASRFGGRPDLPFHFRWPRFRGRPLGLLAQLDLRQLSRFAGNVLPDDGWLVVFYENAEGPWGFDPGDAGGARVVHIPAGTPLIRSNPPADLDRDANDHQSSALAFSQSWDLPDCEYYERELPFSIYDELSWSAYEDLMAELGAVEPYHHLLGYPQPIQGEMRLECQLVTAGIDCGGGELDEARVAQLAAGAGDWRLLLQLDSDGSAPGWIWGDAGRLYLWIRQQDLAAGAFDRCWLILQCS